MHSKLNKKWQKFGNPIRIYSGAAAPPVGPPRATESGWPPQQTSIIVLLTPHAQLLTLRQGSVLIISVGITAATYVS